MLTRFRCQSCVQHRQLAMQLERMLHIGPPSGMSFCTSTPCPVSKCPCPSRAGWPISCEAGGSPTKGPLPRTGSGGSPLQRKGPPTDQVKFDPKNPGQTTFLLLEATGCNLAVVSPIARQQASVNGPRNTVTVDTAVFVRSLTEPSQQQHDRNDRTETAHAYVHRWRGAT